MIYQNVKKVRIEDEDRISSLPDGVIHLILSFFDVKFAVRTSVLSKRWELIWKTLPYLSFEGYEYNHGKRRRKAAYSECIDRFLRRRNHESSVLKLNLLVPRITSLTEKLRVYAISHNVEDLTLVLRIHDHPYYKLSTFNSKSISKLKLGVCINQYDQLLESDCWNLPALTTLHLIYPEFTRNYMLLSIAFLTCLPALTTLCLDGKGHDFLQSSIRFRLPALKSLQLARCNLPNRVWHLPALLSLELEDVIFPENINDFFSALASLQNLTLSFITESMRDLLISCPQLINLQIRTSFNTSSKFSGKIVVSTPTLCNFSSIGIFLITFEVSKLEYVNIRLWGSIDGVTIRQGWLNQYYQRFTSMFPGLASAKILTLDSVTIQELSAISDFLIQSPSPFYNLEYVKLPQEYRESSISSTLRSYLLGGSPRAKIVTTLPQVHVQEEPPTSPSKELVDIHKKVCADTMEMGVPEDHLVGNYVVDASTMVGIYGQHDSVVQGSIGLGPDAPVARADNDQTSSFGGNSDFGLWQGHEVNWEFVSLLDLIAKRYPETFENFTAKSKKLCTMKLNMLCASVNDFTKTSMAEVNTETITEYRALFAALQNLGFNVNWLVSRLDYIEQLQYSRPLLQELYAIDSRIQNLQTLRSEKMTEIEKAFGTMGTNLVVGNIGDDLLSAP